MSDSKHTPFPWRINANEIKGSDDIHTNGRIHNDSVSSRSFSDVVCTIHGSMELEGPKGNARLIAAAPELLSALKAILPTLQKNSFRDYKLAIVAIAKAEGQS